MKLPHFGRPGHGGDRFPPSIERFATMHPIASVPPAPYAPLPTMDGEHPSRNTNEVLAAEWARMCSTDPPLLAAVLEDVNGNCCRFIWAHDGAGQDADGIRRIQAGNGAGVIREVDSRMGDGTPFCNARNVALRSRSQGGYGQPCTFELAYSVQRWHNGGKVEECERDAAHAALCGEANQPCFLNCGEYLLVKMLHDGLCSENELQALASAIAQKRALLREGEKFTNSKQALIGDAYESDDDLPLPDATLPDFDTWQAERQIPRHVNAEDAGRSLPSSDAPNVSNDAENDLVGEALDPSRSATQRFDWREPQRGDIAWVIDGEIRRHVGMVVGRDDAHAMVGIAGLNSASNLSVYGFRWGPKIELYSPTQCRSYPLHDVVAHFKDYCRRLDLPEV
jgi:hypothetical protein